MKLSALLAQPHLSVITRQADPELARIQELIEHGVMVDGRGDLEELFGQLLRLGTPPVPKTLDLIGHSTPDKALLSLGSWVIDAARPAVTSFFRELADLEVLPRLGIREVRLLACQTAETAEGSATLCRLSDILGVEVLGTRQLIYSGHYDARGYKDELAHLLVSSRDLRSEGYETGAQVQAAPYARMLDVDALPASPLSGHAPAWPRRLATPEVAREILRLVRRGAGAEMPGLLAQPGCEVALPSGKRGWYHLVQVLLDGEVVRVYPDGAHRPGVVFPVSEPHALRALLVGMPRAPGDESAMAIPHAAR